MFEVLFTFVIGFIILAIPYLILEFLVKATWNGLVAIKRRAADARARRKVELAHARARAEQHRRDREYERRDRIRQAQRQRDERIAAQQAALQQRQLATEQRRRNDARAQCECRWSIYEAHIAHRYSRRHFDHFMRTFMTDQHAAQEVETRAVQLLQILEAHYAQRPDAQESAQPQTLEDVTAWFVDQCHRVEQLPVDELTRQEHLARLQAVYAELSERVMESHR